jgi:hypothetical protein
MQCRHGNQRNPDRIRVLFVFAWGSCGVVYELEVKPRARFTFRNSVMHQSGTRSQPLRHTNMQCIEIQTPHIANQLNQRSNYVNIAISSTSKISARTAQLLNKDDYEPRCGIVYIPVSLLSTTSRRATFIPWRNPPSTFPDVLLWLVRIVASAK